MPLRFALLFAAGTMLLGCGTSQQFVAIPPDLDRASVPVQVVEMKARRFEFDPEVVNVKAGTLVTLKITALDGTHGFALGAFGIDERIEEGETKTIEFDADKGGVFPYYCTNFCSDLHREMQGYLLVK